MTENLIDSKEVARITDSSPRTVEDPRSALFKKLLAAGAVVKIDRRVRFRPDRVRAVIDASTVLPA